MPQAPRGRPKPSGGKHLRGRVGNRNLKPKAGVAVRKTRRPRAKPKRILDLTKRPRAKVAGAAAAAAVKTIMKKPTQGPPVPPPPKAPAPPKKTVAATAPAPKAPAPKPPAPKPPEEPKKKAGPVDWKKLVKALREEWGFEVDQAAEDLGVSASTFKKWESGESTPNPSSQDTILAAVKSYSDLDVDKFRK